MTARFGWMLRYQARQLRHNLASSVKTLFAWRRFWRSFREFKRIAPADMGPSVELLYPCLGDDIATTPVEPIYFYQDAWAFERIVQQKPAQHVDVGSHHKFVSLLSKVLPVTMVDIRPLSLPMDSLHFQLGSILDLPFDDGSIASLSSLCVVEHIGLGRYGDPLDPYGTEKAIGELKRVLAPGGDFYLSMPISDQNRVYFNAHRAFSEEHLFEQFGQLKIVESRYIFGDQFLERPRPGLGVGCYHLQRVKE